MNAVHNGGTARRKPAKGVIDVQAVFGALDVLANLSAAGLDVSFSKGKT
jgi:hypothetical protein